MADEATTATEAPPPALVETPPAAEAPAAAPESVDQLPEWAQKLLGKTRSEAAANRTKANEQAQALEATRDAIAKALGLGGDADPVQAAQTAAQEREAARQVARNLSVENAVLRSAGKHGADPAALTDSRSFMRALEAMDPESEDFAAQVGVAIDKALETNPALRSVPATPAPPAARSGGPVGGGAAVPGQLTEADIAGMSPADIVKAKAEGRLKAILEKRVEDQD